MAGMNSVRVRLTWAEILLAASVGSMRRVQNLKLNSMPGNGAGQHNAWTLDIEGACGEMAVAKYLGLYWGGQVGDYSANDVGKFQVKTNTSRQWTDLIIRPTDSDDGQFILVLSFLPDFEVCGWIRGRDA